MGWAKKLAAAGVLLLGARALLSGGAGEALAAKLGEALSGQMVSASIDLELGPRETEAPASPDASDPVYPSIVLDSLSPSPEPEETPEPVIEGAEDGNIVETTIYSGLSIKNSTSYDIDVGELVKLGPTQVLPAEGPQILIVHTHGSEAYTPDRYDQYEESDSYRTEDLNYNVVRVGDELAAALEAQGLSVLHDREIYDYPSYTGSYANSRAVVQQYLAQYPSIKVVLDVHRDAIERENGTRCAPVCTIDGRQAAQVMIICGCDNGTSVQLPAWRQNLRFAAAWERSMEAKYPGLTRPVLFSYRFYNQDLTTGSLLIEIGGHGNNLNEALYAGYLAAQGLVETLLG